MISMKKGAQCSTSKVAVVWALAAFLLWRPTIIILSLSYYLLPPFQTISYSKNLESQNISSLIKIIDKITKIYDMK